MANRIETNLIEPLLKTLQKEKFVLLSTVDHEDNGPTVSAISWVYAKDKNTVLFAVESRSRMIANIEHNPLVTMSVISNETTYSISGECSIFSRQLEDVPLKLVLVSLNVTTVRDVMFYGSKITIEPEYMKTYDHEAAQKLDTAVMNAMKKA